MDEKLIESDLGFKLKVKSDQGTGLQMKFHEKSMKIRGLETFMRCNLGRHW